MSRALGWRLWFLQASWNREGMQSLGLLVSALPWARRRGLAGTALAEWMRPRLAYFNTNPYLAGLVLGAAEHLLERERPEESLRLQTGLSRNLGALGDVFFWDGLRPAVAYLGLCAAFVVGPVGVLVAWWFFLLVSAFVRELCLRIGVEKGPAVVDLLTLPWIQRSVGAAGALAAFCCGGALTVGYMSQWGKLASPLSLAIIAGTLACGFIAAWRRWPLDRILALIFVFCWGILHLSGRI